MKHLTLTGLQFMLRAISVGSNDYSNLMDLGIISPYFILEHTFFT